MSNTELYEYLCENKEHYQASLHPLGRCQHFVASNQCMNRLWRVGDGSVGANKALAGERGCKIPAGLPGSKQKVG